MKPTAWKQVLALLFLPLLAIEAHACLWDNDTLEAEAKGIPDTIAVIAGRFKRNPDLFYEMRLKRVTKELASTPETLELYDDAGVACDRLHRGDEAIAWMQKKNAQLEKSRITVSAGVLREQRYRYFANLGTFVAHRWLRNGANRSRISEMKRARNLIAEAIKLNPDAHFGREKYQMKAMDWIINPPEVDSTPKELPQFLGEDFGDSAAAAVQGISGLIVLGDAWQSVDVFNALAKALQLNKQLSSPAYMARLRACEIIDAKGKSILPGSPQGAALKKLVIGRGNITHYIEDQNIPQLTEKFQSLRDEADNRHAQRTAYMMERLKAGRHPDTDKKFWNEWKETPAPSLHISNPEDIIYKNLNLFSGAAGIFFGCWIAWIILRIMQRSAS